MRMLPRSCLGRGLESRCLQRYSADVHGSDNTVEVRDIVYADDHAACVTARNAAALVPAVSHVIGRSLDAITSHGLTANIGPRKTAALLVHRGKGAKAARDSRLAVTGRNLPCFANIAPLSCWTRFRATDTSVPSFRIMDPCWPM